MSLGHYDVVTGAAGFIGSTLVDRLLERGVSVVGIDSLTPNYDTIEKLQNLDGARRSSNFIFRQADILDCSLVQFLRGARTVYHLAGQPGVQTSWGTGFASHLDANVLATQHLFESSLEAGVERVVLASSSSVYGNTEGMSREEDLLSPVSPYGVSKLAGEFLAKVYAERGLEVTVLRYFTVYGPRQRPDMAFRRLFTAVNGGPAFPLRGDGSQRRSFIFVDDVVEATHTVGETDGLAGSTFNIGGGEPVTLLEAIRLVEKIAGKSVPIESTKRPPGDPQLTYASTELLEAATGFQPKIELSEGLTRQYISLQTSSSRS